MSESTQKEYHTKVGVRLFVQIGDIDTEAHAVPYHQGRAGVVNG